MFKTEWTCALKGVGSPCFDETGVAATRNCITHYLVFLEYIRLPILHVCCREHQLQVWPPPQKETGDAIRTYRFYVKFTY